MCSCTSKWGGAGGWVLAPSSRGQALRGNDGGFTAEGAESAEGEMNEAAEDLRAYTGQPGPISRSASTRRKLPRVHGATQLSNSALAVRLETSARTRGNPRLVDHHHIEVGNFRAYTGQPVSGCSSMIWPRKLPRVHGATREPPVIGLYVLETSARTRGNPYQKPGSIPMSVVPCTFGFLRPPRPVVWKFDAGRAGIVSPGPKAVSSPRRNMLCAAFTSAFAA